MRLVIFGPPGAGKGTQAALLETRRGLVQIATGDIIRTAIQDETPVGQEAKAYVEEGELVPDEVVRRLAEEAIARENYDDFVLDGYPRTRQQAEWLTEFLVEEGAPLDAVVKLSVPDDVVVRRLSRRRVHKETGEIYHLDHDPPPEDVDSEHIVQREDDKPGTVRHRLHVYSEETQPLVEYFTQHGELVTVNGEGDIEEVYERITEVLDELRTPSAG